MFPAALMRSHSYLLGKLRSKGSVGPKGLQVKILFSYSEIQLTSDGFPKPKNLVIANYSISRGKSKKIILIVCN